MIVSLTDELAEMVSPTVDSGLYGNASEVVRDAFRLMYERKLLQDLTLIPLSEHTSRS
jgi:antitoxin ParD1/3/4